MKIVSYDQGRATLLFPLEEILPLQGLDVPDLMKKIAARYNFQTTPNPITPRDPNTNGIKFAQGLFESSDTLINIQELSIYNDGVLVQSNTTENAQAIIDDLLHWLHSEFGFRYFSSPIQTVYSSQVVVEFEKPLSKLIDAFSSIVAAISRQIGPRITEPMDLARIDFELDRLKQTPLTSLPRFIIERRPGTAFDQNRYYSGAPMSTTAHLQVLADIERTL